MPGRLIGALVVALVVVAAFMWLLRTREATQPAAAPEAERSPVVSEASAAGAAGDEAYPDDYVDDLPLDDAPPLPDIPSYEPTFEEPDLIGDSLRVPVELELEMPTLPPGEAPADGAGDAPTR